MKAHKEIAMDERQDNMERLLKEITIQLRLIKWLLVAGLVSIVLLGLTIIGLYFFPIVAALFVVAFLIVGPTAYLYYIFVATIQHRESQLRAADQESKPLLSKATR